MDWNAAHVTFVIAAYGVSFAGLLVLGAYILLRDRKLKRQVAALDRNREQQHG